MSYYSFVCLTLLQVAHHYPTIHHLTQTHPHVWLPKRVGTHFFQFSTLCPNFYPFANSWVECFMSREHCRSKDLKMKKRIETKNTVPASFSRTDTHRARTHLRTWRTHTDPKHTQSLIATDKALHWCTFCVFKNNMSHDRAIQSCYLNAVTTHRSSEGLRKEAYERVKSSVLMSYIQSSTGENRRWMWRLWKRSRLGCLLESHASQPGAEAAMCTVNQTEAPDWLLQTRLEWKEVYELFSDVCASELTTERMTEGEKES